MKNTAIAFLAIVFSFIILIACRGPQRTAEEENLLSALKEIQNSLEANTSYEKFAKLLKDVKSKINMLKQAEQHNACFVSAVEKCYASYEIARKAWQLKENSQNPKRKEDMELTFSFSISFASLSIERADNCYN